MHHNEETGLRETKYIKEKCEQLRLFQEEGRHLTVLMESLSKISGKPVIPALTGLRQKDYHLKAGFNMIKQQQQ